VTELRAHAAELIDQIQKTVEELELLRDIHTAEGQLAHGAGVPQEDARVQVLSALRG
jgi:hypothetical protein